MTLKYEYNIYNIIVYYSDLVVDVTAGMTVMIPYGMAS